MMPMQNYGNFDGSENSVSARFSKQQKIGLSVLFFLTLLIIGLWYWQLKKNIIYPLYGGMSPAELAKQRASQASAATAGSQVKDTDKDGLSDFHEMTLYKTSPFLADTDGDSLSDKQEIDEGTDPNCPQGKDCANNDLLITTNNNIPTELLAGASSTPSNGQLDLNVLNELGADTSQISNAGLSQEGATSLQQVFGDNPDPQTLRQQFLAAASEASDKEMITSMSDDQILQLYQVMIAGN